MTPDLKRLCEAAAEKWASIGVTTGGFVSDQPDDWEDVVRAVLMALREPSDDMRIAMLHSRFVDRPPTEEDEFTQVGRRMLTAGSAFTAMIDHVLGEPAEV